MIKIENVDVHGVARAIYSARNAMQNTEQKLLQKSSMLHLRQFVRPSPGKIGNDEWRDFCKWIEGLPCSELITMEGAKE